ncbi:TPA: DUF1837 domain-containing protein [Enterobacter hormaechei subsp. xiangfangensis]|uniref:DUF1837 domain-containing protein n=1 Tax=Enterobacter asburiae TaxID=61645 RepID=UPI0034CD27B7|nr:DUF1837 domain-containing protein [Enterobacter hormaechei subsp. xiangfangensis]
MDALHVALENLIRDDGQTLNSYFSEVKVNSLIENTNATCHFHCLNLDGNGRPRVDALIQFLNDKVVDYAIPRKKINEAVQYFNLTQSTAKITKLASQAKRLFTRLANSGEGGEFILFLFAEQFLKFPQIICKMSLKTSSQMHYHGADGIHIGVDKDNKKLCLYWGESKLYSNLSKGISECMDSIAPLLQSSMGVEGAETRDMQLLESHLNVDDIELEQALKSFLDPDSPDFNKLEYRGICLVGFDLKDYPQGPSSIDISELVALINTKVGKWSTSVQGGIVNKKLDRFAMHVFILPFPSVKAFRASLIRALES